MENQKRKCKVCKQTLRPIGDKRKNGKQYVTDWEERQCCKKCSKLTFETWKLNEFIKMQNKEYGTNVPLLPYD